MSLRLALFAIAVTVGLVSPAAAQNYPSRPVTMVVPFPPGGNTDLMARALQNELTKALGQSVIISNKGGAAGTLGILDLVKAEPDGYTMALTPNNPITAQPHMQQTLRYGLDTFRYVCLSYYAPFCNGPIDVKCPHVIVTPPGSRFCPWSTLRSPHYAVRGSGEPI